MRSLKLGLFPLREITAYCDRVGMTVSRFGRLAVNDPRVVPDIRRGAMFTDAKARRIRRFMLDNPNGVPLAKGKRTAGRLLDGVEHSGMSS